MASTDKGLEEIPESMLNALIELWRSASRRPNPFAALQSHDRQADMI